MTREEAISVLKLIHTEENGIVREPLNMAIKALEQEPCEDAISRQAAIDACDQSINLFEAVDRIKELTPINSQPKTGHWSRVSMDKYVQHAMAYYRCSECGKDIIGEHNYCPNCGAKMESEDKE